MPLAMTLRGVLGGLALLAASAGGLQSQERSILVLDASGSMGGQIAERTKMEHARDALGTVLNSLPEEAELGLMAYGHRERGSCDDIELLVPPGPGTAAQISVAVSGLSFLGKTPLTEAVRRAAEELRYTEEKATVILIADGIETCEADPCALGTALEAAGAEFTAHVVGFGLTPEEGEQLACLAENTGGRYIAAQDADALVQALQITVAGVDPAAVMEAPAAAPEAEPEASAFNFAPKALLAPGVPKPEDQTDAVWEIHLRNDDGTAGDLLTTEYNDFEGFVEPGVYILRATLGEVTVEQPLDLTGVEPAAPEVVFNAARLILHPKPAPEADVDDSAGVNLKNAQNVDVTAYGSSRFYIHAGETLLTASIGLASVTEPLTLAAGEMIERDVLVPTGVAVINGYYIDGMVMEGNRHQVQILSSKARLDGSQDVLSNSYGENQTLKLAPGEYIARVSVDAATVDQPFRVTVGAQTEVAAVLNAGVLVIAAPGAASITVYDATLDLKGERVQRGFDYAEAMTLTAPAGAYVVELDRNEAKTETTATVVAGERTEIAIP